MTEHRGRRKAISPLDDFQIRMADAARTDFDQDILVINPWAFQLFDSPMAGELRRAQQLSSLLLF
jgi:hypothetical protein